MSEQWHVRRGEAVHGPFTATQLRELARRGKLRADDLVRKEGREVWGPASALKGLFPEPPTTPTAGIDSNAAEEDLFAAMAAASAGGKASASRPPTASVAPRRSSAGFIVPDAPCTQRIASVVCSLVACLGTFLPWFFPEPNRTLHFSDVAGGWIPIPLSLLAVVLALPGRWSQPLDGVWRLAAAAALSIVAVFAGWRLGMYLSFVVSAHVAAAANPRYGHVITDAIKWTNTGPALPTVFLAAAGAVAALFVLGGQAGRPRRR